MFSSSCEVIFDLNLFVMLRRVYSGPMFAQVAGPRQAASLPPRPEVTDFGTSPGQAMAVSSDADAPALVVSSCSDEESVITTLQMLLGLLECHWEAALARSRRQSVHSTRSRHSRELLKLDMEILQDYRRACEALTGQAPQGVTDPGTGQAPSDDEFDSDDESDSEFRQRLGASLGGSSSSATGQEPTTVTDLWTTTQVERV